MKIKKMIYAFFSALNLFRCKNNKLLVARKLLF